MFGSNPKKDQDEINHKLIKYCNLNAEEVARQGKAHLALMKIVQRLADEMQRLADRVEAKR